VNILRLVLALGLLVWPALLRPVIGRSRRPWLWARLIVVSLAAGSVLLLIALAHEALPEGLLLTGHDSVAAICLRIGGHFVAGLPGGSWLAAALFILVVFGGARGALEARRLWRVLHVEPAVGTHLALAGGEMVVLPTRHHLAFGVPGTPRQVILSESVVERLRPAQLQGLVRHETAHLELGHHRFLMAGAAVDGALGRLGPVRRGVDTLRLSLERWADEEAAGSCREREALKGAVMALGADEGRVRWDPDMVIPRLLALSSPRPLGVADMWWWPALGAGIAVTFAALTGSLWVHLARLAAAGG